MGVEVGGAKVEVGIGLAVAIGDSAGGVVVSVGLAQAPTRTTRAMRAASRRSTARLPLRRRFTSPFCLREHDGEWQAGRTTVVLVREPVGV